jgi:hypothetical protein
MAAIEHTSTLQTPLQAIPRAADSSSCAHLQVTVHHQSMHEVYTLCNKKKHVLFEFRREGMHVKLVPSCAFVNYPCRCGSLEVRHQAVVNCCHRMALSAAAFEWRSDDVQIRASLGEGGAVHVQQVTLANLAEGLPRTRATEELSR